MCFVQETSSCLKEFSAQHQEPVRCSEVFTGACEQEGDNDGAPRPPSHRQCGGPSTGLWLCGAVHGGGGVAGACPDESGLGDVGHCDSISSEFPVHPPPKSTFIKII